MPKPYAFLPDYAGFAYIDGKLKVASGIVAKVKDEDLRRRWRETVNLLLDQRNAMADIAPCRGENSNVCVAEGCFNETCLKLKME